MIARTTRDIIVKPHRYTIHGMATCTRSPSQHNTEVHDLPQSTTSTIENLYQPVLLRRDLHQQLAAIAHQWEIPLVDAVVNDIVNTWLHERRRG